MMEVVRCRGIILGIVWDNQSMKTNRKTRWKISQSMFKDRRNKPNINEVGDGLSRIPA
jgi:hypothetical protein